MLTACIGRQLTILRPVALYDEEASSTYSLLDMDFIKGPDAGLFQSKRIEIIPVGTPVIIRSLSYGYSKGFEYTDAFGTIVLPTGKRKRFSYIWAQFNEVKRAPWEDESIPELRKLETTNNLSNHRLHSIADSVRSE